MKTITRIIVIVAVLAIGVVAFAWSGIYNIAADDAHLAPTHALLETLRERSIESRASKLVVPDLSDPATALQGAGNYNAMCVGCHLAPGMAATEMSKGLYPAPPNLTKEPVAVANAFWVIKHGIKASGMPAWGKSMNDDYIWNMAAFLQVLPTLDDAKYDDMVARSGGHSHGGGETDANHHDGESESAHDESVPHEHAEDASHHGAGESENDHDESQPHDHAKTSPDQPAVEMKSHRHADGTVESHPVKAEPSKHSDVPHEH
ncbi:MAG: cytochrome c [Dokdonella sp.]